MDNLSQQFVQRRGFFLREAQRRADSLLSFIDRRVSPKVFLLSLAETADGALEAEIFAEKDSWLSNVDFSAFRELVLKYRQERQTARRSLSMGGPGGVDVTFGCVRDSLVKILASSPQNPGNLAFFVSHPAPFETHSVCVCLAIEEDILSKYPSLESIQGDSDFLLSPSFMVSLVEEFLEKHRIELNLPFGEAGFESFNFSLDSILQQAGRDFVGDIAYRVSKRPQSTWLQHIFNVCTYISRSGYELSDARGSLLMAPENSDFVTHAVRFSGKPKLSDIRSTRKLLELTKDGMMLHTDSETVFGLCRPPRRMQKSATAFGVDFLGRDKWQISHLGRPLIVVSDGIPRLPRSTFEAREFADALKKVFRFKGTRKVDKLVELIQLALRERKGTILVFSKSAKEEAKRLAPQSTAIAPILLTRHLLGSLTPIDGAILMTHNGVCHSIGTILDGLVSVNGDSSRGARYNSAVKYIESRKLLGEACMAIVVSEDGDVDIIT